MIRIWGVIRKQHRIVQQFLQSAQSGATAEMTTAVDEICRALDIARPIWLPKHEREIQRFGRTTFLPDDFAESVSFDRFEVEILRDNGKNADPRNDFSYDLD